VKSVPSDATEEDVLKINEKACRDLKLIGPECKIISKFIQRLELSYPVPFKERDEIFGKLIPYLESTYQIYSRGRFADWKYEYSN